MHVIPTEKVQAEIDRVIGQSRQPSMTDRPNLPYTDAVIHEIQRIGNIAPLALPRMTTKDVQIGEHILPKVFSIYNAGQWGCLTILLSNFRDLFNKFATGTEQTSFLTRPNKAHGLLVASVLLLCSQYLSLRIKQAALGTVPLIFK